jgi:hypothetical protein
MDQSEEMLSHLSAQITTRKKCQYTTEDNMELLRSSLRSRKLDQIIEPKVMKGLRKLVKMCCAAPELEHISLKMVQDYILKYSNNHHTDIPPSDIGAD